MKEIGAAHKGLLAGALSLFNILPGLGEDSKLKDTKPLFQSLRHLNNEVLAALDALTRLQTF